MIINKQDTKSINFLKYLVKTENINYSDLGRLVSVDDAKLLESLFVYLAKQHNEKGNDDSAHAHSV